MSPTRSNDAILSDRGEEKERRKTLGASSGPGQREWAITASASRWFDPNVSLMTRLLDQSGTWGFYIGTSLIYRGAVFALSLHVLLAVYTANGLIHNAR